MLFRFINLTVLALILASLTFCTKKVPVISNPETTVILQQGFPVDILEFNLELTLISIVDDIRCDSSSGNCNWPGMAEISVKIVGGNSDTNFVILAIGGTFPKDDSRNLWGLDTLGLHLTLLQLTPNAPGLNITDTSYRATILVQTSSGPAFDDTRVIITDLSPLAINVDPFDVDSMWLVRENLHVAINYGGGCKEHKFSMFMSPENFVDGQPKQATLRLRHYGARDACRAFVHQELLFRIGNIAQHYVFTFALLDSFKVRLIVPGGNPPSHTETFVFDSDVP